MNQFQSMIQCSMIQIMIMQWCCNAMIVLSYIPTFFILIRSYMFTQSINHKSLQGKNIIPYLPITTGFVEGPFPGDSKWAFWSLNLWRAKGEGSQGSLHHPQNVTLNHLVQVYFQIGGIDCIDSFSFSTFRSMIQWFIEIHGLVTCIMYHYHHCIMDFFANTSYSKEREKLQYNNKKVHLSVTEKDPVISLSVISDSVVNPESCDLDWNTLLSREGSGDGRGWDSD